MKTTTAVEKARRALGNCIDCSEPTPAIPGTGRCHDHREKHRQYMREWARNHPRPRRSLTPRQVGRKPGLCRGCKFPFTPNGNKQVYCTPECFRTHRKPWTARKAPVGSMRRAMLDRNLCACSKCIIGRAEAVARKEARDAARMAVRETEGDSIVRFQERIDQERTGRRKQVVPFLGSGVGG